MFRLNILQSDKARRKILNSAIIFIFLLIPAISLADSISGTVTDMNGHKLKDIIIQICDSPCWVDFIDSLPTGSDGTYEWHETPDQKSEDGTVYVFACGDCLHAPYVSSWWSAARMIGNYECSMAEGVNISGDPKVDFQLKVAPQRLSWWEVAKYEGKLGISFDLPPIFEDQLEKATVTGPSGFSYTFDLSADRYDEVSDCAGFNYWWKQFDGAINDGTYTLILGFKDGLERTYILDRQFETIPPVDQNTMRANVQSDGSIEFSWTKPQSSGLGYQVRIISSGKRLYDSQRIPDINQLIVPAGDLACLEVGESYTWQVKTYDSVEFPKYTAVKTASSENAMTYNPSDLSERISWFLANRWEAGFACGFTVRPGDLQNVESAVIKNPNDDVIYEFDLAQDWFDISTETQKRDKGWFQIVDNASDMSGAYELSVTFGDGPILKSSYEYENAAEVVGVDSSSLEHKIFSDGGMRFTWDKPADGQIYNLRIRSMEEGSPVESEEYVDVSVERNSIDLNFWNLRALKLGERYRWFLRVYDKRWSYNKMVETESKTFIYDPFHNKSMPWLQLLLDK